ncbi:D-3-phosphoglycerate dehydrogenase [Neokomagataea thailandica NBRC 106555]|uniref:3-phosphoglycerate dehydrogenase n=2 Tax=Neokomagataea TaxID=1223423 RepID=A0A4Y6V9U6_9PROT|nr:MULTISPECIES: NAD(P)-dependent oxidoreductase [Neokomagataea]QDH25256.1 3-phosphoglycerate dehydrogenase [Neokomagataea tanensis]GBR54291.1 D-3-phosphoglycerate dehydrogenase [Neokomagataea thailandica NBRC 106555]
MLECFITQPVHDAALKFLNERGIATRYASAADMPTVIREIGGADAVITRDLGLDRSAIERAEKLKIISCHGAGTNRVDKVVAKEKGIIVTNAPGANSQSVAELTIGLILSCARNVKDADRAVRDDDWGFRYRTNGIELEGKTLGLIGFGTIAQKVTKIARNGFGMRVIAWSPNVPQAVFDNYGVSRCETVEVLLADADVISLHRAGEQGDTPLINARTLGMMKPRAILVNAGRGFAIDQYDLAQALRAQCLHGAALDVLQHEPPQTDDPILRAPSLILTPHLGGTTEEALERMAVTCANQVFTALTGGEPAFRIA